MILSRSSSSSSSSLSSSLLLSSRQTLRPRTLLTSLRPATLSKKTSTTTFNNRQPFKSFTTNSINTNTNTNTDINTSSTNIMSPIATSSSSASATSSASAPLKANPPPILQACLDSNAEWAQAVTNAEPGFFEASAKGQAPGVLWFGCSDSRVPESVVLARRPGDIFVHRNIANQFHASDDSAHAVLSYAISVLGVRQVIVVGHSSCGGCFAAHGSAKPAELKEGEKDESDALTRFLRPLIHLRHALPEEATMDDLIVANVKEGVKNIAETEVVRDQWERAEKTGGEAVQIHGWHYDVSKGRMSDLGCSQVSPAPLEAVKA